MVWDGIPPLLVNSTVPVRTGVLVLRCTYYYFVFFHGEILSLQPVLRPRGRFEENELM